MTAIEVTRPESPKLLHAPLLSVVVPVFNANKKIEMTLQKLQDKIGQLEPVMLKIENQTSMDSTIFSGGQSGYHRQSRSQTWYEIIVVNDGSRDDTRNIVEKITKADERIRLISYSTNMGKGYAIKQGVIHSQGKYILFMDGDGDISADVLATYMENLKNADMAIGSKYHPHSVVSAPKSRRVLSKCFQLFVRTMLGLKVRDTQVGLKAGNGDAFRKIFQRVLVKRYAFDAEMIAIAGLMGLNVVELPVNIDLDKSFKKKDILRMAVDVLGVVYRLRVIKWYQKNMEKQRPHYNSLALF